MSFLLDTNVVSEMVKPRPDPGVVRWLEEADEDRVFLSVVTMAELRFGISRLPAGRRRSGLQAWLHEDLLQRFAGRILRIDSEIALTGGDVMAECAAAGHGIEAMDALIAATARVHELELVTRNTGDFETAMIPLCNPWAGERSA